MRMWIEIVEPSKWRVVVDASDATKSVVMRWYLWTDAMTTPGWAQKHDPFPLDPDGALAVAEAIKQVAKMIKSEANA